MYGYQRPVRVYRAPCRRQPGPRFEMRELGEIDMTSRALATLDLVDHDDVPGIQAAGLAGRAAPAAAGLAGALRELFG